MNKQKRELIFQRFYLQNPTPTTELNYSSGFELLVAVILSAQATDVRVNIVTEKLFLVANTPDLMLKLGLEGLISYVRSIGLYNSKASNIIATAKRLVDVYFGQVPDTREALESLPGVGRKTANVVLNTLFQQDTIAVDTHIYRVANRIGLAKAKTPLLVEKQLMLGVPAEYLRNAHHWLVLHGRYVCKARQPLCATCLLVDLCTYSNKNMS